MSTIASPAAKRAAADRDTRTFVWQRTDTIGTELVLLGDDHTATGTAVVGGAKPFSTRWTAQTGPDGSVRSLSVTCEGSGWRRELTMTRDADGGWTTHTEDEAPQRLDAGVIVRLADSPIFLTWAVRALGVVAEGPAVGSVTARVLTPSLEIQVGEARYQRLSDHRLRVTGDMPAASYDLDAAGVLTYQPGRLRIVR